MTSWAQVSVRPSPDCHGHLGKPVDGETFLSLLLPFSLPCVHVFVCDSALQTKISRKRQGPWKAEDDACDFVTGESDTFQPGLF